MLVVDDEPNIRSAVRRWFEAHGYEVEVADDGDVALELCNANRYDVVTLDLEMPRLSGREVLAHLHENMPALPVIIFTGYYSGPADPSLDGAAKILLKPLSLHELEREVREVVDEQVVGGC